MNSTRMVAVVLLATVGLLLSASGCVGMGEKVALVDLKTVEHTVDLAGAERAVVYLEAGVGQLEITSGTDALVEATFEYNVEEWEPVVEYEVRKGVGELRIRQRDAEGKSVPDGAKNTWRVILSESVPIELNVDLGVGKARLDLGDVKLTDLSVDHGVGDLSVDLVGSNTGDVDVAIDGGVGKIHLAVPASTGVRVDADTGIGSFSSHGLTKRNGLLVNDAYGKTEATIDVTIDAGIGAVTIESSDKATASL